MSDPAVAGETETPPAGRGGLDRLAARAATALAVVGGLILVGVALTVSASILGRWLLGREVTGAFEIVQVGVALAVFLFLPICQLNRRNIIVDAFTTRTSPRFRAALDSLWALTTAAVAAILAWRLAIGAAETLQNGMVTSMLQLPFGWAMVAGAAILAFLALVSLLVALRPSDELR